MTQLAPEPISLEIATSVLKELGLPSAERLAAILQMDHQSGTATSPTRRRARNRSSLQKETGGDQLFFRVRYPYGYDIVRRNQVNGDGFSQMASSPPFVLESNAWFGIVVHGHVTVTTTHGLSANDSWDTPPNLKVGKKDKMLTSDDCLKYRTTIRRVLKQGDLFFVWEVATQLAEKFFALTKDVSRSSDYSSNAYVYEISSGQGPLLLFWRLHGIRQPELPAAPPRKSLPQLQLGYQIPRFSTALIVDYLCDEERRRDLASEVLWLPTKLVGDNPAFREFVYAYSWLQSHAQRQQLARHEKVQDTLHSHLGGANPYLDHDEYGPCLAATLCYIDEALGGAVPLYRFVNPHDANDFVGIARDLKSYLTRTNNEQTEDFLLAPCLRGEGGMVSLSMPIAPGPVPGNAKWNNWVQGFNRVWSAASTSLVTELPWINKWRSNGNNMIAKTMGPRAKTNAFATRNCPFFRAWVELQTPTRSPGGDPE